MNRQVHISYFLKHLQLVPTPYVSLDTSRMTILYFCVSGLDVLNALDDCLTPALRTQIIEWVYAQQTTGGFRGGPSVANTSGEYDESHIAMTYTALAILTILNDDLSRVNKPAIHDELIRLQNDDGSFSTIRSGSEHDTRFVYCACAISVLLRDGERFAFDVERAVKYLVSCQSYDGGIGLAPLTEGHGGSTYTAVASLYLLGRLDDLRDRAGLLRWCVNNQGAGFRGRPNKPEDTCYSFWLGATLCMLDKDAYEFTAPTENRAFNLSCQSAWGGFAKMCDTAYPDVLHSYMSICGLSIMANGPEPLLPINVALGITHRACKSIHQSL